MAGNRHRRCHRVCLACTPSVPTAVAIRSCLYGAGNDAGLSRRHGRRVERGAADCALQINTNTLFSTLVTFWLVGVMILLTRLAAGCWRVRRLHLVARLEDPSRW